MSLSKSPAAITPEAASAPPSSKNLPADRIADEVQQMMLVNLRKAAAEHKARKHASTAGVDVTKP